MTTRTCLLLASLLALAACGSESPGDASGGASEGSKGPPASYWAAGSLGDARGAGSVKADSEDGDQVVVTGRVKDFIEGYAAFTLIDKKLRSCAEREGDNCPTPWDYCCEASDDIAQNTVLVELRDGARPIKGGIKGWQDLDHLQEVVVKGSVVRNAGGNVIIVAEQLRRL